MRAHLRRPLGVTMAAAALSITVIGCAKDETTATAAGETSESTTTTIAVNSGEVVEITSVAGKFGYEPDRKQVEVNEAVIWRNTDATKHTVTASADQTTPSGQPVTFKSPTMATDAEFVQTFSEPGTYTYFCSIHGVEKMSGTIEVMP